MSLRTVFEAGTKPIMNTAPELAIRLEDVSVRYRVPQERYGTMKEYIIRLLQRRVNHREFWALRGINVMVCRGEVFGIIGRNGAGKSTLLKVVSRVLRPTRGRVWVKGRVAPLLELGAGFHPELTGRENVFLNGTLLGHPQGGIKQRYTQIEEFADIGSFIEAPLRTYSTGMVARLGFAVATAWEPDILVLDEVLAVGDEAFQQKCYTRINSFREQGSTVLLVSHNAELVRSMCQRAAWIEQGNVQAIGPPDEVVDMYRASQHHDEVISE